MQEVAVAYAEGGWSRSTVDDEYLVRLAVPIGHVSALLWESAVSCAGGARRSSPSSVCVRSARTAGEWVSLTLYVSQVVCVCFLGILCVFCYLL